MKKILIFLLLTTFLTGCAETDNINQDTTSGLLENGAKQADLYSRPETRSDISGTIKSIVGNEVTITARDMSAIFGKDGAPSEDFRQRMQDISDEEREKMRDSMNNAPTITYKVTVPVGIAMGKRTVERPASTVSESGGNANVAMGSALSGGGAGGMRGGMGMGRFQRDQGSGQNLEGDFFGGDDSNILEASLSDLKAGLRIDVWLDKSIEGRKIADNVFITEVKNS